jgi:hypothetical protein
MAPRLPNNPDTLSSRLFRLARSFWRYAGSLVPFADAF